MQPPNVIVIIADDLAWGDLEVHGNPYVRTPRLNDFHVQSTRLTRYTSGPLCTPARACLMTGRYAYRTRAIDTYLGRSMLDPEERTLAHLFAERGYRTGIFGKWHLGDCYPMRPVDMGFDEELVHAGGGLRQPGNPTPNNGYFDPDLSRNGRIENVPGYCSDIFTDAAIDFVQRHRDQPFFTYLAYNAPHTPLEIAEHWAQPYRDPALGLPEAWARLYGMIANLDWNVGRLLDHLAHHGLDDNTIVLFTSDHGPCPSTLDGGHCRFNADLRGIKGEMYEGGIRVPSLWRWPRRFGAGIDVDRLAHPIDVMPTLAEACGLSLPSDRSIDGVSVLPLLEQRTPAETWPDREIFMQWHRGDTPVARRNSAVLTQQWKLYRPTEEASPELYDILNDRAETRNVAASFPDRVAAMTAAYDRWFEDVSSTRPANYAAPRIELDFKAQSSVALTWQDWRTLTGEGWSDEHRGYWLVTTQAQSSCRVTIHFAAVREPAQLILRFADESHTAPLQPGDLVTTFDRVSLPQGDFKIAAWIEAPNRLLGVRQVDLRRPTSHTEAK